jgi:hypothetical protein
VRELAASPAYGEIGLACAVADKASKEHSKSFANGSSRYGPHRHRDAVTGGKVVLRHGDPYGRWRECLRDRGCHCRRKEVSIV